MKDKTALLMSCFVIIGILFLIYKHHEFAYGSGLSVWDTNSTDVSDWGSRSTELFNLKEDIQALQKEIIELEEINGTGVGVYAMVLNDNVDDLKRIRTELKVRKDDLYYEVHHGGCQDWNILGGDFEGKECAIIDGVSSEEVGKYIISAMVSESGGGRKLCGTWNPLGIMKNGRCENFNSFEDFLNIGIKKRVGGYFNRLEQCGVSKECINSIFIGAKKYCQPKPDGTGCEHWYSNFISTYKKLN